MTADTIAPFNGFTSEALQFLADLKANSNNKPWFEAHQEVYQNALLAPMKALVATLADFMLSIDPYFEVTPAINRTISRLNRDVRFSQDKSLYRANMWITFKRPRKNWLDAPAFYFELFPDWYRYGMGYYSTTPEKMARFRAAVDANPPAFLQAVSFYHADSIYLLEGELYKKPFSPAHPAELQTWYQRKSFYLVCNRPADERLFSPELANDLVAGFRMLTPLYRFLADL